MKPSSNVFNTATFFVPLTFDVMLRLRFTRLLTNEISADRDAYARDNLYTCVETITSFHLVLETLTVSCLNVHVDGTQVSVWCVDR